MFERKAFIDLTVVQYSFHPLRVSLKSCFESLYAQSAIRGYFRRNTHKLSIRYIKCVPQTRQRGYSTRPQELLRGHPQLISNMSISYLQRLYLPVKVNPLPLKIAMSGLNFV